jgi:membrane protease YdiL (CAAX protease family)
MAEFSRYRQSLVDIGTVMVLAAAPFEEALFRLTIASVVYRGLNPLVEAFSRKRLNYRRNYVTKFDYVTMLIASLVTSWLFVIFHAGVYSITDWKVMQFLFLNSVIYTMVYLYTGDIMTSTTAHLLHNAAVMFL